MFDSSASHLAISFNDVLLTRPDLNNSMLGVLIWFRSTAICTSALHVTKFVVGQMEMPNLPSDHFSTEPPFTNMGLNVFDPCNIFYHRTRGGAVNYKRWAVLFTCLSIRAVHIKLIVSMNT